MDTTLTFSEYFSSNSAVAPDFIASSIFIILVVTGIFILIVSFTISSTSEISLSVILEK